MRTLSYAQHSASQSIMNVALRRFLNQVVEHFHSFFEMKREHDYGSNIIVSTIPPLTSINTTHDKMMSANR